MVEVEENIMWKKAQQRCVKAIAAFHACLKQVGDNVEVMTAWGNFPAGTLFLQCLVVDVHREVDQWTDDQFECMDEPDKQNGQRVNWPYEFQRALNGWDGNPIED